VMDDIHNLANKIYGSLMFDKHKVGLYWDKRELHIIEYPHEYANLIEIDIFTPGLTIKEIEKRLINTIAKLVDGPRIHTSMERYADAIRRHYLAETT
jgi:hypothetical protein